MNDRAASVQGATPPHLPPRDLAATAPLWHLGWAFGVVAAGAALLAGLGEIGGPIVAALAAGAAPGLIGYLWRPLPRERRGLVACWAVGASLAASLSGGLAGPLGAWCLTPLLAGGLIGALAEGAVLSAAALAVTLLVELAGGASSPPSGALGVGLAATGVLTVGGAGAAALAILADRARERVAAAGREAAPAPAPAPEPEPAPAPGGAAALALMEQRLQAAERARAEAEAARAGAEANAVGKSRFLANMSHELRTPLNAIMGFSDIMRAKMFGELPGKYAEYAELIHESGRHLTDLINDVLDMSKIEAERYALSREVFDVREAINAALRLVRLQADEAGVQLRGLFPPQPLIVDADRRALKQIVLNLVSNALKFTPRGGSVSVTAQAADGAFELVVADTGVGIAKDDLERLGRPFEQAGDAEHKAQGTGLGLSLVKALARLHGGEMNIESVLGEGAAVTIRLPVLAKEEPLPAPPPRASWVDAEEPPPPATLPADGPEPNRPRMGEVIPLNLQR